jgi:hypothetical protein
MLSCSRSIHELQTQQLFPAQGTDGSTEDCNKMMPHTVQLQEQGKLDICSVFQSGKGHRFQDLIQSCSGGVTMFLADTQSNSMIHIGMDKLPAGLLNLQQDAAAKIWVGGLMVQATHTLVRKMHDICCWFLNKPQ